MEYFEEFYKKHVKMVYRICLLLLKNVEDAEDATQNVFLKFLKAERTFQSEEHEKVYLIVTARNTGLSMLRQWWRKNRCDITQLPEEGQCDSHLRQELWNEIAQLHEKYRMVLYLYYFEGYSTDEIGEILNVVPATVRGRLKTARILLKKRLEVNENDWKRDI